MGALDAALRREMQLFLKEIQRTIRTTFLFVTHDQEEAIAMADRICVMDHGRVVQVGTPEDVYWRPADAYVARFFGDANLIPGRLGARDGTARRVDTPLGCLLATDQPELPSGSAVQVMVRPEAVRLDGVAENRIMATVVEVTFAGPMFQVLLAAGETILKAKLPSRADGAGLTPGCEIEVSFAAADARPVTG